MEEEHKVEEPKERREEGLEHKDEKKNGEEIEEEEGGPFIKLKDGDVKYTPWAISWLFFICHLVFISPIFCLVILYLTYLYPWVFIPLIVIYYGNAFIMKRETNETGAWAWYRKNWKEIYYGTFIHYERGFKDGQQYIIGYHPHGIFPIGTDAFLLDTCDFQQKYPILSSKLRGLAASVFYYFPLMREHALWKGYVDASRPIAESMLMKGYSLAIVLGGEREVLEADPDSPDIKLLLKNRYGFVRLGLKYGVSLVPSFGFGQDKMWRQIKSLKSLRLWVIKKFKTTLTLFWGRFLLLPYKHQIDIVVGNPIPLPKIDNPDQETIEKYHKLYVDSLVNLFNKYKGKFGYENRELVFF